MRKFRDIVKICQKDIVLTTRGLYRPFEIQSMFDVKQKPLKTYRYVFKNGIQLHLTGGDYRFYDKRFLFINGLHNIYLQYLHQMLKAYGIRQMQPNGGFFYYINTYSFYLSEEEKQYVDGIKKYLEIAYHYWADEKIELDIEVEDKVAYIDFTSVVNKFRNKNVPIHDIPLEVRTGSIDTLLTYVKPFVPLFIESDNVYTLKFVDEFFAEQFFNLLSVIGLKPIYSGTKIQLSSIEYSILSNAVSGQPDYQNMDFDSVVEIEPIKVERLDEDSLFFDLDIDIEFINGIVVEEIE